MRTLKPLTTFSGHEFAEGEVLDVSYSNRAFVNAHADDGRALQSFWADGEVEALDD